jgi:hypothetical protein
MNFRQVLFRFRHNSRRVAAIGDITTLLGMHKVWRIYSSAGLQAIKTQIKMHWWIGLAK